MMDADTGAPAGKTAVVPVETMDNETFVKHVNHRHAMDLLAWPLDYSPHVTYIPSFRAFHDRCHAISTPTQYDHLHVPEEYQ
jgi:hypothetical protein